jgi:hypothetical protein
LAINQTDNKPGDFAVYVGNQAQSAWALQEVGYVFLAKSFYGEAFSLNLVKRF